MQLTDINEINNVVKALQKCTVGLDSLSKKRIQQTIEEIVIPLGHIIKQSFVTTVVPENLKSAKEIPTFKSRNKPICILHALSQYWKKIVCNRLISYLEKYNIVNKR